MRRRYGAKSAEAPGPEPLPPEATIPQVRDTWEPRAGLHRTVSARLAFDWLCCQPLFERSVYARLPTRAARAQRTDNLLIQPNGNLLLCRFLVGTACSTQCRNSSAYATTRRDCALAPIDFGSAGGACRSGGLRSGDLGRTKALGSIRLFLGGRHSGRKSGARCRHRAGSIPSRRLVHATCPSFAASVHRSSRECLQL